MAVALLLLLASVANAGSPQFCRFIGSISASEGHIAGGTLVTAVIEGKKYHTHTATVGDLTTYSITIIPLQDRVYPNGALVHFKINGVPTEQVGSFQTGANVRLDLIASASSTIEHNRVSSTSLYAGPSNSDSAVNWGAIIGVLIGVLVAGVLTYYVILLRRAIRKGLLKQKPTYNPGLPRRQSPGKK